MKPRSRGFVLNSKRSSLKPGLPAGCSPGSSSVAFDATHSGLLDPGSRDPAVQRELASWLRLQAALGLRPESAARLLRESGSAQRALARAPAGGSLGARELERRLSQLRRFSVKALPLLAPGYP